MPDPITGQSGQEQQQAPQDQQQQQAQGQDQQGQQQQPTGRDWLPEPLRTEKSLEKFKDIGGLAKSYVELEKQMGSSLKIPAEGDVKGWDEFHKKLGRPDTPEAYQITQPTMNVGLQWDPHLEAEARKWAHGAGLSNAQFQGLINWWGGFMNNIATMSDRATKEAISALKEEWGPSYTKGQELAKRFLATYGGAEAVKYYDDEARYNPLLVRIYAKAGEQLVRDGHIDGSFPGAPNKADAQRQIDEIRSHARAKDHPYWNGSDPGHKQAVADFNELMKIVSAP